MKKNDVPGCIIYKKKKNTDTFHKKSQFWFHCNFERIVQNYYPKIKKGEYLKYSTLRARFTNSLLQHKLSFAIKLPTVRIY